ncbi:MAG: hypothetical protein R3C16_07910 [Hyphomonadaceae bacterium]
MSRAASNRATPTMSRGCTIDIRPDQRILFAEDVTHGDTCVSAAMISVEISQAEAGARLLLTMQIVALDGSDMEQGYQFGCPGGARQPGQGICMSQRSSTHATFVIERDYPVTCL